MRSFPCADAPYQRFKSDATCHHHLDDDLLETLDCFRSQRRGYNNRPKRSVIFLRGASGAGGHPRTRHTGFRGTFIYVYEHEKRDLASRIVSTQHHHHRLVLSLTLHARWSTTIIRLEIAVQRAIWATHSISPDDVIAQRGVRHGHFAVFCRKKTNAPALSLPAPALPGLTFAHASSAL
ncbi:nickel-responsive transcriptional regulator NikR [Salmonella enterica subsp. enterica]|nr:nickel-responsive transcriptional regulator NikR [Salmonella enterica subsp. enterica]